MSEHSPYCLLNHVCNGHTFYSNSVPTKWGFYEFTIFATRREGGRTLRKDVFLPSKHLLSAFYETLPSKNPPKNFSVY